MGALAFDTAPGPSGAKPGPFLGLATPAWSRSIGPLELVVAAPAAGDAVTDVVMGRVAIILAEQGVTISQGGMSIDLRPGEWTLARGGRALLIRATAPTRIVMIPTERLPERGLVLHQAVFRRFPVAEPINRMVQAVFCALFDEASGLRPGEGADLAQAALHVLKNALARVAGYRRTKAVLADRVREFIEWNIRDPALSPEHVARGLRCTPRHVHRAFEGEPETVGQYILRRRLERCRNDLLDTALQSRSVTEVAFSWGFNNAAHFSRVFKRQFGCCPRRCRQSGLAACPRAADVLDASA